MRYTFILYLPNTKQYLVQRTVHYQDAKSTAGTTRRSGKAIQITPRRTDANTHSSPPSAKRSSTRFTDFASDSATRVSLEGSSLSSGTETDSSLRKNKVNVPRGGGGGTHIVQGIALGVASVITRARTDRGRLSHGRGWGADD